MDPKSKNNAIQSLQYIR